MPSCAFFEKMNLYNNIEKFEKIPYPVLTAGTFDGVHLGHKKIIGKMKRIAERNKGQSVLLTYSPHPRSVLFPKEDDLQLINSEKEKIQLLEESGIDHLIIHPFTKKFSQLTSSEFVREYLVKKIGVKRLVIGYNHHFGRNREGTLAHLLKYGTEYGFEVDEIPAEDVDNISISSTKIRNALLNGDLKTAKSFLGYDYFFTGTIIKGEGKGRSIGFPTANIKIEDPLKLIPCNGVYAVVISLEGTPYQGMLNIGVRPTINREADVVKSRSIEVNIFQFEGRIYDKPIKVSLLKRIRDEKRFDHLDGLRNQLALDKIESIRILSQ